MVGQDTGVKRRKDEQERRSAEGGRKREREREGGR